MKDWYLLAIGTLGLLATLFHQLSQGFSLAGLFIVAVFALIAGFGLVWLFRRGSESDSSVSPPDETISAEVSAKQAELRKCRKLRAEIEEEIGDCLQLNRDQSEYESSGWADRSRALFDRCVQTLSHPFVKDSGCISQFQDNAGFGGAVNGPPVPRGEFRRQQVIGRHVSLIRGLEILDEASRHLGYKIELLGSSLPRGKHQDTIDKLEKAITDLLAMNRDDTTEGRLWGERYHQWADEVAGRVLSHPYLIDRYKDTFRRLTSGANISPKPVPLDQPFRGMKIVAREISRTLPVLKLLDEAKSFLEQDQELNEF